MVVGYGAVCVMFRLLFLVLLEDVLLFECFSWELNRNLRSFLSFLRLFIIFLYHCMLFNGLIRIRNKTTIIKKRKHFHKTTTVENNDNSKRQHIWFTREYHKINKEWLKIYITFKSEKKVHIKWVNNTWESSKIKIKNREQVYRTTRVFLLENGIMSWAFF